MTLREVNRSLWERSPYRRRLRWVSFTRSECPQVGHFFALSSNRTDTTTHRPPMDAADIDALLLDDELDDCVDREIAAIRESLAERHF